VEKQLLACGKEDNCAAKKKEVKLATKGEVIEIGVTQELRRLHMIKFGSRGIR